LAVKIIERATRAELKAMGVELETSALARTAVELAQRLDAGPTDRDATALSRELRMVLGQLHARHDAAGGELDGFLAGLSAPTFRRATD
jgi:hypothetical protein